MRLLPILILGAAALATPALALTISAAPNRDQAQHLKPERSSGGLDVRDTLAGGGRPFAGTTTSGSTYSQTQTFSFGSVTTTYSSGREDLRQTPLGPTYVGPGLRPLQPVRRPR